MKTRGFKLIFTIMMLIVCSIWGNVDKSIKAEPKAFNYILPMSDSQYYTIQEINDMSAQVLCYARNEIYARHNRIFKSEELTEYFELQPWYNGTVKSQDFNENNLNRYETENLKLIQNLEKSLEGNKYILDQSGYSFDEIDRYISSHAEDDLKAEFYGIASNLEFDDMTRELATDHFELEIPMEWVDHYGIENDGENAMRFYCKLVRENETYGGTLFAIDRYVEYYPEDYFPYARYIGERDAYHYYFMRPTDVQFNPEDQEGMTLYREMDEVTDSIFDTIRLK